mgnify:CR=1 FL=1
MFVVLCFGYVEPSGYLPVYCWNEIPYIFSRCNALPGSQRGFYFVAVLNDFFQGFKALVKAQLAGIHQHSVFGLAQRGCCTVGILIVARADIGQNISGSSCFSPFISSSL